jgi:dephospho-CoA kinase
MPWPLQVGITGGIGSGKSTVSEIFACLGVPVYDADSRAKNLMNTNAKLMEQIKSEFGDQAYEKSGQVNRKYLAEHVFGFPERLEKLNSLVHPQVAEDFSEWADANKSSSYVLKEAALLYESGSARNLNKIIAVVAPDRIRISRVMKRDNRSETEIKNIIDRQLSQDKIRALADFVIVNDESSLIIPQVLELHKKFTTDR